MLVFMLMSLVKTSQNSVLDMITQPTFRFSSLRRQTFKSGFLDLVSPYSSSLYKVTKCSTLQAACWEDQFDFQMLSCSLWQESIVNVWTIVNTWIANWDVVTILSKKYIHAWSIQKDTILAFLLKFKALRILQGSAHIFQRFVASADLSLTCNMLVCKRLLQELDDNFYLPKIRENWSFTWYFLVASFMLLMLPQILNSRISAKMRSRIMKTSNLFQFPVA